MMVKFCSFFAIFESLWWCFVPRISGGQFMHLSSRHKFLSPCWVFWNTESTPDYLYSINFRRRIQRLAALCYFLSTSTARSGHLPNWVSSMKMRGYSKEQSTKHGILRECTVTYLCSYSLVPLKVILPSPQDSSHKRSWHVRGSLCLGTSNLSSRLLRCGLSIAILGVAIARSYRLCL